MRRKILTVQLDGSGAQRHYATPLAGQFLAHARHHLAVVQSAGVLSRRAVALWDSFVRWGTSVIASERETPFVRPSKAVVAESALLCVLYSALALEACANEVGEGLWCGKDLEHFWRCQGTFHKPKQVAEVRWKWRNIFAHVGESEEKIESLLVEIQWLMNLRNDLVHYKVTPASRAVSQEPPTMDHRASGRIELWNADWPVVDVKSGVMDRVLDQETSARSVRVATDVFSHWNELQSKSL